MKNVKVKNNLQYLILFFFSLLGCKDSKNTLESSTSITKKSVKNTPLDLKINLITYGSYDLNVKDWKNNLYDTVAYFHINLKNLKKEPFIIKTHLMASNIPFQIEYQKLKKNDYYPDGTKIEYFNLNIVHQFNTVYVDSIVFKIVRNADYPGIEQVFQVGYQKVGGRSLCELPFEWREDTLDITNPKNKHICCIEVNR